MGDLDAHENLRELLDTHRRQLRVHICQILLHGITLHARAYDVQEGQDARSRGVNHPFFELSKILPSGAAHVNGRSHAAAKGESVRGKTVGSAAVGAVRLDAVENMHMDVDQSRRNDQPGHVYDLPAQARWDV